MQFGGQSASAQNWRISSNSTKKNHAIDNCSQVIASSLLALQEAELAAAYRAHALEWATDLDQTFWETTDNLEQA